MLKHLHVQVILQDQTSLLTEINPSVTCLNSFIKN